MQGSQQLTSYEMGSHNALMLGPRNAYLNWSYGPDNKSSDNQNAVTLTEITIHLSTNQASSTTRKKFRVDF